jgi:glucose-1-phosphate adenylyltransferase
MGERSEGGGAEVAMHEVLALILGGGRGARFYPLTLKRSEPAVPVAGKYRLIDIPVSNCLNSGVHRVYVLTQFLSVSLHRHIAATYKPDVFSRGFVEVLAAQQTNETADWYQGTADALRQNRRYIEADGCQEVLVLSADQLYRMDFRRLVADHRARRADVTVAVTPVARERAPDLGVVRLDDAGRVVGLVEKPQSEAQLLPVRTPAAWLAARGVAPRGREFLANTGIYLFRRDALFELLAAEPTAVDLVRQVLAPHLASHHVAGHLFDGYWEDLGTIKSYHAAHMALAGDDPPFDFHSPEGVIYTRMRYLPASHVRAARVAHSLIADGCEVAPGARLERCVVGIRSRIGAGSVLRDTVMIGADQFETAAERAENRRLGRPDIGVADGCAIERCIIDKDRRVGRNVRIVNRDGLQFYDGENFVIRDGIVVLPNGTVVPDGTVI